MLLEFRTANYKSFADEICFSMTAAPKQKGLDYSLLLPPPTEKKLKGICSSVIYGPNAAGKTNIIGAMDTFQAIVARGNIRNAPNDTVPNFAASSLELIPNQQLKNPVPVFFGIDFIEQNQRIQYHLKLDLGTFLDKGYSRKILEEALHVNGKKVFLRNDSLQIADSLKSIHPSCPPSSALDSLRKIAARSLHPQELFLTNGFKLIFSPELANLIIGWLVNKFMVIYRADSLQLLRRFADPKKNTVYVEKTTNEAAKLFGISSNAVGYAVGGEDAKIKLFSIFSGTNGPENLAIPAEIFESFGTLRFINIFPVVLKALLTGGTLIVDEFDASIHPTALMNIINIFHNNEINRNQAQLIFNTHNPIFLNPNLFRRDEIKFIERDDDTHQSILYSLADFGTSGDNGVRKHEDYMKNYFVSRYGAIRDIDFSTIFEQILSPAEK